MERIADYVIRKINEAGVEHIFLIVGRGILYLTDAVAKNKNIRAISTYHEQGASFAAIAYALAKKNIGACLVSTGCAATNAVTACLCAYQDSLPVIFISGNNPLKETTRHTGMPIRTYGSQEADIISIVKPCTKYAVMLENKDTAAIEIEKAIYIAQEGRQGPVWIDIPVDVQNMRIQADNVPHFSVSSKENNIVDLKIAARRVSKDLIQAKRPVLLLGGGTKNAGEIIAKFVDKIHIPVVFSPAACDVYGSFNKLSIGAVGSIGGSRAGNFTLQNADYLLALGTKLSSQLTGMRKAFARAAKIVVVDIDNAEHKKNGVHIDEVIQGSVENFLPLLLHQNLKLVSNEWINTAFHYKEIFSLKKEPFMIDLCNQNKLDIYTVADKLSNIISSDTTVITDAGFEELIIPSSIKFCKQSRCLFPASQGAMGYAIPAILGAYFAGHKNIYCVVGDGSFMMNMQELSLIVEHRIPAKIIVINNNMYAVIRKRQRDLFRNRTIGNDPSDGLPAPNFRKIAESVGIGYEIITSADTFTSLFNRSDFSNRLMLIEVVCVAEQKYFHESYALNKKNRLVHRPIEDMAPFLDRDIIKREMIVDILDESS